MTEHGNPVAFGNLKAKSTLYLFSPNKVSIIIAISSALILAISLVLEHIGGYRPCHLCLEERIPYFVAVPTALLGYFLTHPHPIAARVTLASIAFAFAYAMVLSAYHVGIEWHWWLGPDACTGIGAIASSPVELIKSLNVSGNIVVRCDEIQVRVFGLSLAAYGTILSAFLAILAGMAALTQVPNSGRTI